MVPEASLRETEEGTVPETPGWFVLNARGAVWREKPGQGHDLALTGSDEQARETMFPMLGMSIRVMSPGEPSTTYHWESEQEDFLVLSGEAVLIIEGQERRVRQWDFVHCPPGTRHAFAGAGSGPCVLLCAGSRGHQAEGPRVGYCADPVAERYNASPPEDTEDRSLAYARFPAPRPRPYPLGLLPE